MTQYIGYDLGDGDTLVSFYRKGSDLKNALMPGQTNKEEGIPIPTLLSIKKDGTVNIGDTVFQLADVNDFAEVSVNFKRRPSTLLEKEYCAYKEKVVHFTDALFLNEMFFNNTIDPDDSQLVLGIGYPTLWDEADVARYQEIFSSCGFIEEYRKKGINVTIDLVQESRAAMLNILNRVKGNKASKSYIEIENGTFFVVFDFGSSTTDVTLLKRDGDYKIIPHDYGDCNLGARLIDWGVYRLIMENLDEKVRAMHQDNEFLKCKSVYLCRGAKERYFTLPIAERMNIDWESALQNPKFFPLAWHFDGAMVNKAATLPNPELGGTSYQDAVDRLFKYVAKSMADEGLLPSLIILTGGASRMDFIQTLCRKSFPKSKVYLDFEPSSCISRGLVHMGIIGEKVKRFEDRVRQFCESPEIGKIIDEETPKFIEQVAKYTTSQTLAIIEEKITKWRNGDISTLNTMEKEINVAVQDFISSKEFEQKLTALVNHWFAECVVTRVNPKIAAICTEFGVVYENQLAKYADAVRYGADNITIKGAKVDMLPVVVGAFQELMMKFIPLLVMIVAPIVGTVIYAIVMGLAIVISNIIFWALGTNPVTLPVLAAIVGVGVGLILIRGPKAMKEQFMKNVKDFNLPMIARNAVTNAKIQTLLNAKKSDIYNEISKELKQNDELCLELRKNVASAASKIVQVVAKQITLNFNE